MRSSSLLIALALSFSGCTDDEDGGGGTDLVIADTPLAGTVAGQPWTFVAGDTDAFLSHDGPDFFANFYSETFTTCGGFGPDSNGLIVSVPMTPGEYEFTNQRNMTFSVDDGAGGIDNLVTFKGKVRVDEVMATSLKGGLVGRFNGDNEVSGQFTINVCPEGP